MSLTLWPWTRCITLQRLGFPSLYVKWGLYLLYEVTRGIEQEKKPNIRRQILYDSIYTTYLEEIHCDKKTEWWLPRAGGKKKWGVII